MIKLKYDYDSYRPDILSQIDFEDIKKEYERLRKYANRHLKAISKTKYKNSQIYKYNAGRYPEIDDFDSKTSFLYALSDLARFTKSKLSTVAGLKQQEKRTIDTLHERGYDFVNSRNFRAFVEYMDTIETAYKNSRYDSEYVAEIFEEYVVKKKVKADKLLNDFEKYYEEYRSEK